MADQDDWNEAVYRSAYDSVVQSPGAKLSKKWSNATEELITLHKTYPGKPPLFYAVRLNRLNKNWRYTEDLIEAKLLGLGQEGRLAMSLRFAQSPENSLPMSPSESSKSHLTRSASTKTSPMTFKDARDTITRDALLMQAAANRKHKAPPPFTLPLPASSIIATVFAHPSTVPESPDPLAEAQNRADFTVRSLLLRSCCLIFLLLPLLTGFLHDTIIIYL